MFVATNVEKKGVRLVIEATLGIYLNSALVASLTPWHPSMRVGSSQILFCELPRA